MVPHVYKMDLDGGNLVQLTHGAGELAASVDPQGRWVLHTSADSSRALWRVPLSGGSSAVVVEPFSGSLGFSPDGERIAYVSLELEGDRIRPRLKVIPAEGGAPIVTLPTPSGMLASRWSPDGRAVDYVREVDGKWNIWRLPLEGGDPRRLTDFASLRIFNFRWSPDGRQLVLSRGEVQTDVVALSDFR
jgi:Tol biopolymer transport system component